MATSDPVITSLTSIDPSKASALTDALTSATHALATATYAGDSYAYSKSIAAASNSLAIISAQAVYATATGEAKSSASEVIMAAATELAQIAYLNNPYRTSLNTGGNVFFCVVFGLVTIFHFVFGAWRQYWYFMFMFGIGSGLDFGGFVARCVSTSDIELTNPFLVQIILLTIAPAFIMAGIYYMLGRQIVFLGSQYSWLKPRWFSYIYITCDIISLVIQAAGGGIAAVALEDNEDTDDGTHVMVAGIAWQVFTMATFLIVGCNFVFRAWFRASEHVKFTFGNLITLFFNLPRARELYAHLDPHYDPQYREVRARPMYPWTFTAILVGTICVFIRCIYRLVELADGWTGYVIRHEAFLFTLDAMLIFITCLTFCIFHPGFLYGKHFITLKFNGKKTAAYAPEDNEKLYDPNSPSPSEGEHNGAWNAERGSYETA